MFLRCHQVCVGSGDRQTSVTGIMKIVGVIERKMNSLARLRQGMNETRRDGFLFLSLLSFSGDMELGKLCIFLMKKVSPPNKKIHRNAKKKLFARV